MRLLAFLLLTFGLAKMSQAAKDPCSGKKGGVARCDGELWVCNDGSISGSKRTCSAVYGGSSTPLRATGNAPSECPCGTGTLCTGPRGGQYCITASGNKSYRKK